MKAGAKGHRILAVPMAALLAGSSDAAYAVQLRAGARATPGLAVSGALGVPVSVAAPPQQRFSLDGGSGLGPSAELQAPLSALDAASAAPAADVVAPQVDGQQGRTSLEVQGSESLRMRAAAAGLESLRESEPMAALTGQGPRAGAEARAGAQRQLYDGASSGRLAFVSEAEPTVAAHGTCPDCGSNGLCFTRGEVHPKKPAAKLKPAKLPRAPRRVQTNHEIYEARYGGEEARKLLQRAHGLEGRLNKVIFGQEEGAAFLTSGLNAYLESFRNRTKEPAYVVFAGLPGIGKSFLPIEAAKILDIPVETISLHSYTAKDDEKTTQSFSRALVSALQKLQGKPGILVLDELHTQFQIDQSGKEVDRPIMGIVNPLLNEGKLKFNGEWQDLTGDFSKIFIVITLNLRSDVYGELHAHPDLTSIRDLQGRHQAVGVQLEDKAAALSSMFAENTFSRLLPATIFLNPLDEAAYRKLIDHLVQETTERLLPKENDKGISLAVTRRYKQMLFEETVVPATGSRNPKRHVGHLVEYAYAQTVHQLPYPLSHLPLTLTLDFDRKNSEVVVTAKEASPGHGKRARKFVARYPHLPRFGVTPIPKGQEIPRGRFRYTTHEVGHAIAAARYGIPFEFIRGVPISKQVGGIVKAASVGDTGRGIYAELLMFLASRAMERIVFSPDPHDRQVSYTHLSPGSADDLIQATGLALKLVSLFGLDASWGPMQRYKRLICDAVMTQPIPEAVYERVREIVNRIEDFLVRDLLAAHSREWYLAVIDTVARAGRMLEAEFYQVLGYAHPNILPSAEGAQPGAQANDPEQNLDRALREILDIPPGTPLRRAVSDRGKPY